MGLCLKCIVHSYHNSISRTSTLLTWRKYGNKCDCAFSNQKLEDSVILQKETACSQDWRPSFPLLLILWSPVRVTFSDWLTNLLGMLFFLVVYSHWTGGLDWWQLAMAMKRCHKVKNLSWLGSYPNWLYTQGIKSGLLLTLNQLPDFVMHHKKQRHLCYFVALKYVHTNMVKLAVNIYLMRSHCFMLLLLHRGIAWKVCLK